MVRKGYTAEQIISKLREAEILLSQGNTIGITSKNIVVSEFTYYTWGKESAGLANTSQPRNSVQTGVLAVLTFGY